MTEGSAHDKALSKLRELAGDYGDIEMAHVLADDILCKFLRTLGYDELVDAYDNVEKWYA